jgi:hypothetical protein
MSARIIIEGIKQDGNKFRPSDWCERLATTLASFGEDQRLQYCKSAHPCIINGINCLIVDRVLETNSPESFNFLMSFARENKLNVLEDKRMEVQEVKVERRGRRILGVN